MILEVFSNLNAYMILWF